MLIVPKAKMFGMKIQKFYEFSCLFTFKLLFTWPNIISCGRSPREFPLLFQTIYKMVKKMSLTINVRHVMWAAPKTAQRQPTTQRRRIHATAEVEWTFLLPPLLRRRRLKRTVNPKRDSGSRSPMDRSKRCLENEQRFDDDGGNEIRGPCSKAREQDSLTLLGCVIISHFLYFIACI